MRFVDLRLTRFGAFEEKTLNFGAEPGLVVVFGPNEGGKSTTLKAIADFLFGVPERTAHGAIFGGDAIRISATLLPQQGDALTLVRRKGRSKTLMDSAGAPADEAFITRLLGGTSRDRFETLFGLDHERLRNGGDALLSAEGDIGRLIVEAGGGLRALVERLTHLDQEIDQLFDMRRSGSRQFYKVLDVFEAAATSAKAKSVSLESFDRSHAALRKAEETLEGLTTRRKNLVAEASRIERLVRVAPILRNLDQVRATLGDYIALPVLPPDFGVQVSSAISAVKLAIGGVQQATSTRDGLKAKIDALPVDLGFCPRETSIRDAAEAATHVAKAREDRPAREVELAESLAQLSGLRQRLALEETEDLSARLPGADAIKLVQSLAADSERRSGQLLAAVERVRDLETDVEDFAAEIEQAVTEGHDKAAGVSVTEIAALPGTYANFEQRRGNVDADLAQAAVRAERLGYDAVAALEATPFPSPTDVSDELAAREALRTERSRLIGQRSDAEIASSQVMGQLEALTAGSEIATDEALSRARQARTDAIEPLRATHLAGRSDDSAQDRVRHLAHLDRAVLAADEIADRHATEAQRSAALAQALRTQQLAEATILATTKAAAKLDADIEAREASWLQSFPDAATRFPQLPRLRTASDERTEILQLFAAAEELSRTLQADETAMQTQTALLELAERLVGFDAEGTISERVKRAIAAVNVHEHGHAAFRAARGGHEKFSQTLELARGQLTRLQSEETDWRKAWTSAVETVGLQADVGLDDAKIVALEWASARGVLTTLENTQRRLDGMHRDEIALKGKIATASAGLDLALPEDAVAAGKMLQAKLTDALGFRRQYQELEPDLQASKVALEGAERALEVATEGLEQLSRQAGLPQFEASALSIKTESHKARSDLQESERSHLVNLVSAGDGATEADLRETWQNRDVDILRAEQEAAQAGANQADTDRLAALATVLSARAELATHQNQEGATAAEAEREAATAELHEVVERYVELSIARDLIKDAIETVRKQQQNPMIARAGALFKTLTLGDFSGIGAEVDAKGQPSVVGQRKSGSTISVKEMSDGTRDQLFLAFRLAALEEYGRVAEPLPFVADDILVHFDDERSVATLEVLADFAQRSQVLLFTHHEGIVRAAESLPASANARVLTIAPAIGTRMLEPAAV